MQDNNVVAVLAAGIDRTGFYDDRTGWLKGKHRHILGLFGEFKKGHGDQRDHKIMTKRLADFITMTGRILRKRLDAHRNWDSGLESYNGKTQVCRILLCLSD